ncbi:hypothetical protein [Corynebacterium glutamicum]|uniref:hypothetical protein n=1 Tax=Corynebacterium glutamicum TaxID=1718 RepID=UPI000A5B521E
MSTLDIVAAAGERHGGQRPANFLDIGGGASAESMAAGLDVILGDSHVRSVFVNVFGGITACDVVAKGIVGALDVLGDQATKPLVVRLDGNNVVEGRRILAEYNHPWSPLWRVWMQRLITLPIWPILPSTASSQPLIS